MIQCTNKFMLYYLYPSAHIFKTHLGINICVNDNLNSYPNQFKDCGNKKYWNYGYILMNKPEPYQKESKL